MFRERRSLGIVRVTVRVKVRVRLRFRVRVRVSIRVRFGRLSTVRSRVGVGHRDWLMRYQVVAQHWTGLHGALDRTRGKVSMSLLSTRLLPSTSSLRCPVIRAA